MSGRFVRQWLRLAALFAGVLIGVAGFIAAINWASAEAFRHPWDDVVSSAVLVLVLSFAVAFMTTRDRSR